MLDINLGGVVHGTRAFLPLLVEQGSGAIVNVSSVFGLLGFPTQSAYCASKFARARLHRVAAPRAARHGRAGDHRPPRRRAHEHRAQLALPRDRRRHDRQGRGGRAASRAWRAPRPSARRRSSIAGIEQGRAGSSSVPTPWRSTSSAAPRRRVTTTCSARCSASSAARRAPRRSARRARLAGRRAGFELAGAARRTPWSRTPRRRSSGGRASEARAGRPAPATRPWRRSAAR